MSEKSIEELVVALRDHGPSRELDREVWAACSATEDDETVPPLTFSIDAAVAFAERVMPGWSWRAAKCHVSDDAWLIPDFLDPVDGERLRAAYRQDVDWTDLTDVDLRPSGRVATAICMSLLLALEASRAQEYQVRTEQSAVSAPDAHVAPRDEMIVVPKSMMRDLYDFFHETWEGTGKIDEPGSFGEELHQWREKVFDALKLARYRKIDQEEKP
jgi:hypothetical protein